MKLEIDIKSQTTVLSDIIHNTDSASNPTSPIRHNSDATITTPVVPDIPRQSGLARTARSAKMEFHPKFDDPRRDSSSSNDSASCKKVASLDQLEDLYSALEDLVKTNVTKQTSEPCPRPKESLPSMRTSKSSDAVSDRRRSNSHHSNKVTSSSAVSSPRPELMTSRVDTTCDVDVAARSPPLRRYTGRTWDEIDSADSNAKSHPIATPSATETMNRNDGGRKRTMFRRAALTANGFGRNGVGGGGGGPAQRRTSAQPMTTTPLMVEDDFGMRHARSNSFGGNNNKNNSTNISTTGNTSPVDLDNNKKWKHKLLSRIRSKTSITKQPTSISTNTNKSPTEVKSDKSISTTANSFQRHVNENAVTTKTSPLPSPKLSEIVEGDADNEDERVGNSRRLSDALSLETSVPVTAQRKTAESELDKLEAWFEKAAANALRNHSRTSSDYDNDSDSSSRKTSGGNSGGRAPRRRAINRNKNKVSLRRNKSIHDPVKRERRMRQVVPGESYAVKGNRLSMAKSTPDLRDLCDSDDNVDDCSRDSDDSDDSNQLKTTEEEDGELECVGKYRTTSAEGKEENMKPISRRISLEREDSTRLPKSPVFYRPENERDLKAVSESNDDSEHARKKPMRTESLPIGGGMHATRIITDKDTNDSTAIAETKDSTSDTCHDSLSLSCSAPSPRADELLYDHHSNSLWRSTLGADSGTLLNSFLFETSSSSTDHNFCGGEATSWGNYENEANTANRSSMILL